MLDSSAPPDGRHRQTHPDTRSMARIKIRRRTLRGRRLSCICRNSPPGPHRVLTARAAEERPFALPPSADVDDAPCTESDGFFQCVSVSARGPWSEQDARCSRSLHRSVVRPSARRMTTRRGFPAGGHGVDTASCRVLVRPGRQSQGVDSGGRGRSEPASASASEAGLSLRMRMNASRLNAAEGAFIWRAHAGAVG